MPGASEQVDAVFTYAYEQANQKTQDTTTRFNDLHTVINTARSSLGALLPKRGWGDALSDNTASFRTEATKADYNPFVDAEYKSEYATVQAETAAQLSTIFADYFANWFSLDASYEVMKDWVNDALTGASGIDAAIEAQLWNRDRARVLEDAARAEDEAVSAWAARGFPLPPGAAAYQVHQIRKAAQNEIATASHTAAIKSFEAGLENARLAVGRAIELRQATLDNAEKFFRMQLFPQTYGHELENARYDIRRKFQVSLLDLFKWRQDVFDKFSHQDTILGLDDERRRQEKIADFSKDYNLADVEAALKEAEALATQASAALNALHASAAISGSDQTTTNL